MYLFVDEEIKNRDQDHWDQAHHQEVSNLNGSQCNTENQGSVLILMEDNVTQKTLPVL